MMRSGPLATFAGEEDVADKLIHDQLMLIKPGGHQDPSLRLPHRPGR